MSNVSLHDIAALVAEVFGLPPDALLHPAIRVRQHAKGRYGVSAGKSLKVAAYLARRHTTASWPEIAKAFGNRGHGDMLRGAAEVDDELGYVASMQMLIERLESKVDELYELRSAPRDTGLATFWPVPHRESA